MWKKWSLMLNILKLFAGSDLRFFVYHESVFVFFNVKLKKSDMVSGKKFLKKVYFCFWGFQKLVSDIILPETEWPHQVFNT